MYWISRSLFLSVAFLGAGAIVYLLFPKKEKELQEDPRNNVYNANSMKIEVEIPRSTVGGVVGRGGHKIKDVQCKTNTQIYFRDSKNSAKIKICVIRGSLEGLETAEKYIHEASLNANEKMVEQVFLPIRVCSLYIGKFGEKLRWIRRYTRATIFVDNWGFHTDYSTRRVILRGTKDQILQAKHVLADKVKEDSRTSYSSCPYSRPFQVTTSAVIDGRYEPKVNFDELFCTGMYGLLEIFVTSIENPERFWIQILGPSIVELDKFTDEMTDFYEQSLNRMSHHLKEVTVGMVIAAPYERDNKWYRAEVKAIEINKSRYKESLLEVFYVDFGDMGTIKLREAFKMNSRFMSMKFQAIECMLFNIKPRDDEWSKKGIDYFKKITTSGVWKTLCAQIIDFKAVSNGSEKQTTLIPCITLVDPTYRSIMDISAVLVRKGYAVWEKHYIN